MKDLADADVEVLIGNSAPDRLRTPKLRWLQVGSAGVDHLIEAAPWKHLQVTNARGVYAVPLAEYVMAAGDDWQHYRYFSPGSSDHFRVEDRGRSGIVPTRSGHVSAGSRYTLLADVIHGVQTDADRPTVSLVLQGPDLRACTTVLTRQSKGTAASTDIPVRRLDGERYRRYLLQSRALVAASVGVLS